MVINVMDQLVIDIYNIRNIESIQFFDIYGNEDSKVLVIPALMVHYDGGKVINLCAKDKYFELLVKKVVEVYADEKDNIREDSLTDPFRLRTSVSIDDRTKNVLSSGLLTNINDIYNFYDTKDSYDSTLLFQIDEIRSLMPIIQYHVKKVFGMTDINISFNGEVNGYRDFYNIGAKVNGIDRLLILSFNKVDGNVYDISIQGLLGNNIPFNIVVDFSKDSLRVNTIMGDNLVSSESEYLITNEVVKEIHKVMKNGLPISYENTDLTQTDNDISNITDIDSDTCFKWFRLPWGAMYGINNSITEVSETEKMIEKHNMYVGTLNDNFMLREYYSKCYRRNKTTAVDGVEVVLDEVRKIVNLVCIDAEKGIYAMETAFLDDGFKSGYYDEHLAKKYFYHIVEASDGIKSISREGLVYISKEDSVLSRVDLLNKANIYRLIKGE